MLSRATPGSRLDSVHALVSLSLAVVSRRVLFFSRSFLAFLSLPIELFLLFPSSSYIIILAFSSLTYVWIVLRYCCSVPLFLIVSFSFSSFCALCSRSSFSFMELLCSSGVMERAESGEED